MTAQNQDNEIYVGEKPFMNYVTAIVMQFTTQQQDTVHVKARGKHISRAADVVEIAIHDFLDGVAEVSNIELTSQQVTNKENKLVRVSTLHITLQKK